MTYIENIFICLAIPMLLSCFFIKENVRKYTFFVVIGMGMCLLSAYVNSFFTELSGADLTISSVNITPICEEIMKILPLLFYFMIFEPEARELPAAAIAIAVGFATFENACYLTENGAENFYTLLIRGASAGAIHILCGIFEGIGISHVFCQRWLILTGTIGILGACIGFHAIYNLLIIAEGSWRMTGYFFPLALITFIFAIKQLTMKMHLLSE